MRSYLGGCHCGAVKVAFASAADPASLETRSCGCGFCSRHGARTVSDPEGVLAITFEPDAVRRYRFGLGITDFIVCGRCGCYVAAIMEDGGATFGIANTLMFKARDAFTKPTAPRDYGAEDEAGRRARRRAMWTPVTHAPDFDAA